MKRKVTDTIVIHCSASAFGVDMSAAEIDEIHRAPPRKWRKIGYAQVIRRDGLIEFGRHFDNQGAHVAGHNRHTVGVCLIGGLMPDGEPGREFFDTFTREQEHSLLRTISFLKLAYPDAAVVGHRDLSPDIDGDGIVEEHEWLKACPTFDVAEWMREHGL